MNYFLDLDDTLLDFRKAERANLTQTLKAANLPHDKAVLARFHAINDGLWKLLERGEMSRATLLVRRFELLADEFSFKIDPKILSDAYFSNFLNICYPFRGAKKFLRTLSGRGDVYIVTNGSAAIQHRHIADAGFAPYIKKAFISEEVGADKPSAAFVEVVKRGVQNFENEPAMFMGDSLTSDMVCAERLGVPFVLFAPHGSPPAYLGPSARTLAAALILL